MASSVSSVYGYSFAIIKKAVFYILYFLHLCQKVVSSITWTTFLSSFSCLCMLVIHLFITVQPLALRLFLTC